ARCGLRGRRRSGPISKCGPRVVGRRNRRATMAEPDVVLTDYVLAAESFLFVALLAGKWAAGPLVRWLMVFFACAGVASACGGTVHGFFGDGQSAGYAILWRVAMLAIGVATLANWAIGAYVLCAPRARRAIIAAAFVQLVAYACVVIFVTQDFRAAIVD